MLDQIRMFMLQFAEKEGMDNYFPYLAGVLESCLAEQMGMDHTDMNRFMSDLYQQCKEMSHAKGTGSV